MHKPVNSLAAKPETALRGLPSVAWALALVALLGGCGERGPTTDLPPSTPEAIVAGFLEEPVALRRGESLFLGSCASFCHGLPGQQPAAALADASFLFDCDSTHSEDGAQMFAIIKEGIEGTRMVGFGDNFPEGDDDIWKLIAYIQHNRSAC